MLRTLRLIKFPGSLGNLLILLWLISRVSSDWIRVNLKCINIQQVWFFRENAYYTRESGEAVVPEI